jgi:predicted phosphodiesterase
MNKNECLLQLLILNILIFGACLGNAQENPGTNKLYFISDCQQPMKVEELRLKPYRNEEARDSLFSDLLRRKPQNLFLLGDLTSTGSNNSSWEPIDNLLNVLHANNISIHAIPGNHEYYRNPQKGIGNYRKRFPESSLCGYCVKVDSVSVVMLNSNFNKISDLNVQKQQTWYKAIMDSLDADKGTRIIIVCAHHAPFSNSKIVGSSKPVIKNFIPGFMNSSKSRLFISGHSHNLEYFKMAPNKHFLVIGGGGGLTQPLLPSKKQMYSDVLQQDQKPLYFYLVIERKGNRILLDVRGIKKDFGPVQTFPVGRID